MTKEDLNKLSQEIDEISNNFEDKPWTDNVKLLKEDFDINSINTPSQYLKTLDELEEVLRETRLLFLYSVLNIVCKESGKNYNFDNPFQASMKYTAVMKKEGSFYLLDEDGDYGEIFTSEKFMRFIDDQYWELYEQK
ncbi:hypothetical protein C8N46_11124 [Kordia periserrulae]|uniref:Uncharacterized protein n=1 Tax=Kordia periserrulae TaxID=701523 RepID=A0A2T6BS93_9FLAO|nr:hypothetical protein [Kordia periserrulae]PTX58955.1 hypothetical protein C8N46_11124 [Kordia periserrulae]